MGLGRYLGYTYVEKNLTPTCFLANFTQHLKYDTLETSYFS